MTGLKSEHPILITADPIGGVWRYALDLCRELSPCRIALASMGRSSTSAKRAQVNSLKNVELFESDLKLEWMADPWRDVTEAGEWLCELAARIEPCLVHLNQFSHGALDWQVPCLVVGHSCVYSWFHAVHGREPGAEWHEYKHRVMGGLQSADRVTAPSRWMLASLKKIYGEFSAAEAIYNGRAKGDFIAADKQNLIFTAGRLWDRAKNIAVLDSVATQLEWPIFAAGEITGAGGTCGKLENLRLLGRLDAAAVSRWMARAAIFVLPAYYEPFGLSVLEAALAGCALVLGDIPSLREIWHDTALFVPPGDGGQIAAALAALTGSESERKQLAGVAYERALGFTTRRTARAYMALYQDMLSAHEAKMTARTAPPASSEGIQP